jgi:hypothetical protein
MTSWELFGSLEMVLALEVFYSVLENGQSTARNCWSYHIMEVAQKVGLQLQGEYMYVWSWNVDGACRREREVDN